MKNDKQILADRLSSAVGTLYEQASLVNFCETDEGFYCDYDIPPLSPAIFSVLSEKMGTANIDWAYELESFSGVYEDGNAGNRVLQRIYASAFPTKAALEEYKRFREEAKKRDHKTLGRDLRLFSGSNEIGQGLTLWHPKGAMVRYLLENFGQTAHILNGYQWVYTPHIGKADLWRTSGHLDFYRDSMYSPIAIDGEEYYLKPMNCPFHIQIYNSAVRSYRDLPIRYAEYGTVYRYELSGALNGLTRVRGFTQDDAHIICTPEQVEKEVSNVLQFSLYILRSFGLDRFEPYISTKPKQKSIGSDADWEMATEILKRAVSSAGLSYQIDEGGGAFYGPKIDLKLRDALNREWQCSTIQFDFNLPQRFDMSYVGGDGQRHAPFMIHRALFGSLERFMALLIEHYGGDFPFWLSPVQFGIIPIREAHNAYAKKVSVDLRSRGFRCELSDDADNMRNKLKRLQLEKIPYILVIGDKEQEDSTVSARGRRDGELGEMGLTALYEYLTPQIQQGIPRMILED